MGFYERARAGAADAYGRANMERYARQARIRSTAKWMAGLALAVFLIVAGCNGRDDQATPAPSVSQEAR
jgi:hypothetical protein